MFPELAFMNTCRHCSQAFEITSEDLAFYRKVSPMFSGKEEPVPPPTLCPDCRMQRRLSFRNERSLHHRTCSKTGKSIISMYPQTVPFPVYDNEEWWKDDWSGLTFGREFDFNRTFTEQFKDLMREVPKMARVQQGENINSQYTNCASYNKNCYLIFSSNSDEDCLYGACVNESRSAVDCYQVIRSELCYECVNCEKCYNCAWLQDCTQCTDSRFLKDCVGCTNCFACVNLRNKQYHILNQPYSKEEYEAKMREIRLGTHVGMTEAFRIFREFALLQPVRYYQGVQNESVSGNYISHSKNAQDCFDVDSLEDCRYCTNVQYAKDTYDMSYYGSTGNNELICEGEGVGHGVSHVLFSKLVWGGSSDILCSYECFSSQNCFGCTGLKKARHCILNKQYSKDEYEALVPTIIEHMRSTGEWGEFFAPAVTPFGYNETVAHEYFPLTSEAAQAGGWRWTVDDKQESYMGPDYQVPDDIAEVPDDVTEKILLCEATGKPYKIIPQELIFCRTMGVPLSRICPDERHRQRMQLRNPRKLWDRECANCHKLIRTTYAPDRPEIVYCEDCYLKTVY
jgi:hypothetical protein